jgi:hypothetical protein
MEAEGRAERLSRTFDLLGTELYRLKIKVSLDSYDIWGSGTEKVLPFEFEDDRIIVPHGRLCHELEDTLETMYAKVQAAAVEWRERERDHLLTHYAATKENAEQALTELAVELPN